MRLKSWQQIYGFENQRLLMKSVGQLSSLSRLVKHDLIARMPLQNFQEDGNISIWQKWCFPVILIYFQLNSTSHFMISAWYVPWTVKCDPSMYRFVPSKLSPVFTTFWHNGILNKKKPRVKCPIEHRYLRIYCPCIQANLDLGVWPLTPQCG